MMLTWVLAFTLTTHLIAAGNSSLFFRQNKMDLGSRNPCPKGEADLESQLKTIFMTTPWLAGWVYVPSVGNVFYRFTRISTTQAILLDLDVTPIPDGLKLSVTQGSMDMNGYFTITIGTGIPQYGNYHLNVMGIRISASFDLNTNTAGRPMLVNSECNSQISNTNANFYGSYYLWLQNVYRTRVDNLLREAIKKEICSKVINSANLLKECLPHLPGESQNLL